MNSRANGKMNISLNQGISNLSVQNQKIERSTEAKEAIRECHRSIKPHTCMIGVSENEQSQVLTVTRHSVSQIDSDEYGNLWCSRFTVNDRWLDYRVFHNGKLDRFLMPKFDCRKPLFVRIDSGCFTGQHGDRTCDCWQQLCEAKKRLARGQGIIIHIPQQEGRGMGLDFKLATLRLQQSLGIDNVEAAMLLAGAKAPVEVDVRTYAGAIAILKFFNIPTKMKLQLGTNNPHKLSIFAKNEYVSVERIDFSIPANEHTSKHFKAKNQQFGHLISTV